MAGGREEKVEARLAGGDSGRWEENRASDPSFAMEQRLPSAVIATILSKLDLRSLCAASASCRYLRSCTIHTLSFMPSFHLLEIAPELDHLMALLPPNPYLRSLKLDCSRLDDSAIGYLARSSLQELCLHNCDNLSGRLLFALGRKCPDLSTSWQLHFRMAREREEVEARLAGGDSSGREENGASDHSFEMEQRLPSAVIGTILSKLDPRSLCAASASCRYLRSCAIHTLSFMPSFHLLDIAPELDLLRPLLPPNPYLRSLKLDCSRLDYSAIGFLARSSLQELCLHNCDNFGGWLLFELGRKCPDLR